MPPFPTSKYARYKRATAFFLDWLVRARGRGRHGGKRVQLDEFSDVVTQVAARPATLTPRLLQELPKALAACQCAITFREHVAQFFADDDEAQGGHRHFLELLKSWHETLTTVTPQTVETVDSARFKNYYQVLEVDEDYFPNEETLAKGERHGPRRVKADRNRVFDQAFEEDLRLEIACYFLELEELVEEVHQVYDQVKKGQRSMVEATVVVKVAMQLAEALTAGLQFRYPALQTAEDVLFVLMDHSSSSFTDQMAKLTSAFRDKFEKDGTYAFVPGMLLHDFASVWWTLASFASSFGVNEDKKAAYWNLLFIQEEDVCERYGEDRTPEHVLSDSDNMVTFLLQQLPMLYNAIKRKSGSGYKRVEMVGHFMALFEEYFDSRQVSISLVFASVCWIKSVAALQGDAVLSRNISLSYKHSWDLMKKMEGCAGDALCTEIQNCAVNIRESSNSHALTRVNPILAGFMTLTHHVKYLLLGSSMLLPASRLRAFSILYIALTEQGFLERIPFFDELLEVYDDKIFTPSRAAVVHGDYNRAHLLSDRNTPAAVNAIYQDILLPNYQKRTKPRSEDPWDLSSTYLLVIDNDMSCLRGVSPKAMLRKAANICSKELFQTRTLSRDLMSLHDDLGDAFSEMCDALGRRQFCREYIAGNPPGGPRENAIINAPVTAVTFPLLSLMDALQPDGSMKRSALPVGLLTHDECAVNGEQVRNMCSKVAAVIKARFAASPLVCEQKYFLFPSKPDFVAQEYGVASFKTKRENENRERVFSDLMDLLRKSNGPLSERNLSYLKAEIKQDPQLLGMFSPSAESDTDSSSLDGETPSAGSDTDSSFLDGETPVSDNDLCTLLHEAAAGPAHDIDLVEWMIQMGALANQRIHCRKEPQIKCIRATLPNTMAVHSAVIAGYEEIARAMLEADNLVDLNTPTFYTKDTLAHLAVKHGHRKLLHLLRCFGSNVFLKNRVGKHVGDMVAERGWSNESAGIFGSLAMLEETSEDSKCHAMLCRQVTKRAERLRELIFSQCNEERQNKLKTVKSNGAGGWKKTKSQRRKLRKAQGNGFAMCMLGSIETDSAEFLSPKSTLPGPEDDGKDKIDCSGRTELETSLARTSIVFTRLRDPSIPAGDKADEIERACTVIRKLEGLADLLSDAEQLRTTKVELRIAVSFEAHRVIHMMQKFYQVDHATLTTPAFTPVRKLCETTHDFTKFVVDTAKLCISVNRQTHAREILDLLEKRLLKTPFARREPLTFREVVQTYSTARDDLGLGRTSSFDAFRRLESYLSNTS
ncbi:hypothetical protein PHYPSEUDO_008015 [Phytophthora pseudosyringae]|uniref:DUF6604 domain-containing protein n=1 Tax=Phytophthora pseudosyringae TaxID=221518 RepID=A0A8T1VI89_9STRA|nr:hypothetical protein PHYPSEUDO_008015 [Phytophthora pseudosyringae]